MSNDHRSAILAALASGPKRFGEVCRACGSAKDADVFRMAELCEEIDEGVRALEIDGLVCLNKRANTLELTWSGCKSAGLLKEG